MDLENIKNVLKLLVYIYISVQIQEDFEIEVC